MKLDDIQIIPLLDTLRLEKIDDATYFSKKYNKYVSNSRLGLINPKQDGSPEKFFEGFKQEGFNSSFQLGTMVHSIVLQNESFEIAPDLGKPTAKLGAIADELFPIFMQKEVSIDDLIKASNKIDYYKGKITKERYSEVITKCTPYWEARQKYEINLSNTKELMFADAKTRNTALSCIESLQNNKYVQELLHPKGVIVDPISENEQTILLDVKAICPNGKEFILSLKAKIDNFTINTETNTITVNDVKTLGRILSEFNNNKDKYHYSREIAVYIYLLKLCAAKYYNLNNPKIQANYLIVSTVPDYYSKVQSISYNELKQGFHEFKILLKYVAYNIAYKDFDFK